MRWRRATKTLTSAALLCGAWMSSSCAPSGFADETLVASVRILASSADPAYAQPGSNVGLEVLAFDARPSQPEPMQIYWLPFVCDDPTDDAYYACFQQLEGGDAGAPAGDGGAGSAGLGALKPGVDLTPFLPTGPSYQFQMPSDVVTNHTPVAGEAAPYGLGILFNIACAGHLELVPLDPTSDNPQQIPLGCFDQNENQLGPDDWVLGFTRVYAFEPDAGITNNNPVISSIDVQGSPLTVTLQPNTSQIYTTQAFTTSRCTASRRSDCPHVAIGPVVPSSSWETTQEIDSNNNPEKEEIWADFYSTFGQFTGDASLLYDATKGSIGDPSVTDNQFLPPDDPGSGFIWIVVHDNRGGASWVTIPVDVQ
ncbi:MAG TPA: hypothetical protein VGL81_33320 [Polyangiaceae bacterium]|jgi:hypothetical protein